MKAEKDFDCVRMKNDIQKRLYERRKGMTPQEEREAIEHDLATSQSPIAVWWRKVSRSRTASSAVSHPVGKNV